MIARLYSPEIPEKERQDLLGTLMELAKESNNPALMFMVQDAVHYTGLDQELSVDGSKLKRQIGSNYATRVMNQTSEGRKEALATADRRQMMEDGLVCNQAAYMAAQGALGKVPFALAGNATNYKHFQGKGGLSFNFA